MAGVRWFATRCVLSASLVTMSAWPPGVAASEDEVITLPGFTATAGVVDLDGDGVRELVRLVAESERGALALETWSWDGSSWQASARLALERSETSGEPLVLGPESPATLLSWHDGERERLLLATGEANAELGGVHVLSISLVASAGTRLSLTPVLGDGPAAERIDAADLDADGIEELIVTEPGGHVGRERAVWLLGWSAGQFDRERIVIGDGRVLSDPILGETDGNPGVDLLFAGDRAQFHRLAPGSSTEIEHADLSIDEMSWHAWPAAVAGGAIFVHADGPRGATVFRVEWPAGQEPSIDAIERPDAGFGFPQSMPVGDGVVFVDDPSMLMTAGPPMEAVIRDADLRPIARVAVNSAIRRTVPWRERAITAEPYGIHPFPYSGPLPGGFHGAPAIVVAGNLVVFGDDGPEIRPVGSFVGVMPLGLLGPDAGWIGLSSVWWSAWDVAYLYPSPRIEHSVRIAPADLVLREEADDGELDVELRGATRVIGEDGAWVASPDGGFEIVVHGMPGSSVAAMIGNLVDGTVEIGAEGSAVLRLEPRPRRQDNVDYSAAIVMITPTGQAYGTEWRGRVLREPPGLEASAATETGTLSAGISGEVDATATVAVDGRPVTVGRDGAFSITVEAGIVPRDVVVVATDPIGNETAQRLQVVGLVDYRSWPWVPIAGGATILFGVGMYLRAPRGRSFGDVRRGDGTIEEIDAG